MPGRITELSESQIVADLLADRRRQAAATTSVQMPQPAKDTFTVAASPATTYTLSAIPYQGTGGSSLNFSLNGLELVEGVDYTVDYTTAVVTVSATLTGTPTPADVLTADYWTTGDLIALTGPADTGTNIALLSDTFNRPDNSASLGVADSGQTWTAVAGVFGISTDQAKATSTSGGVAYVLANAGGADGHFRADVTCGSSTTVDASVIFRATSNGLNMLWAQLYDNGIGSRYYGLVATRSGVDAALITTSSVYPALGSTHHVDVTATGPSLSLAVDGTTLLTYTLTGSDVTLFDSNTYAGFRVASSDTRSTFDNINYSS